MSGYLLDTNVLAELRKRERGNAGVSAWFAAVDDDQLYLSVLVVGEIRRGVELLRRRDPAAAGQLDAWLLRLKANYASRILSVNSDISELWGSLGLQQPIPPIDGLLAATALFHGLTFVTRNVADIERSGVTYLNPFSE